jgi:hypothetical protein
LRQTDFPRVHDVKFQVRDFAPRKGLSRELNHLRRSINANDGAARHGPRDFRRHLAVAAADIENVLVPAQLELRDEFARPGLLHGGIRCVISRVPHSVFFLCRRRCHEAHFKCRRQNEE